MPLASPRDLPSVDRLLQHEAIRGLLEREPRALVVQAAREALEAARKELHQGTALDGLADLPRQVEERVWRATHPPLRPVVNATRVIIQTNLGRAPLRAEALAAVQATAAGYANLEYDLAGGERGSRHDLATDLLRRLTGAEDALVVNNNAAAVLLALSALARGKEAIISRGQLVEIGGGFRIPDVMRESGATLAEVGTTNRTYASDYEAAITERTALLLRVHASNFLQLGFTHSPRLEELVSLADRYLLPVVDDLGSGSLLDTSRYGLAREPMVQESIAAGAALVCFSGDKLLGGPQAGIIVGKAAYVTRLKTHPLTRAVRPDKLTLAALGATLVHYLRGEAERIVPVWRMLSTSMAELEARCHAIAGTLPVPVQVVASSAAVGGGSLPGQTLPSRALAICAPSADRLAAALRAAATPVVARIERDRLLLDLRTVLPDQDATLSASVREALAAACG
jgi:L-seryl-tRNA(Ser) seleniumtransferase